MMQRTPEPELMDSAEQAAAYAAADFSASNQAFVEHLLTHAALPASGVLYDLGCGPADILLRLAPQLPDWQLVGLDGGPNMLQTGITACRAAGLDHQIRFQQCFFPDSTLMINSADAVISNSLLHHLSDPLTLWQTIRQLGKPGAVFQVMDLFRPADTASARDLVQRYTADASPVLQQDFYNSLCAAYTPDEIKQQLRASSLQHWQLELPSDRHFIVRGRIH